MALQVRPRVPATVQSRRTSATAPAEIFNQMVDIPARPDIVNQVVLHSSKSLDAVFHALAHPARREMLRQLSERELNLTELAAPLKMSFPAASKHVRVLERARLVRRRIVGRTHRCRIAPRPLARANVWLEQYRRIWEGNFQRLDALLGEMKDRPNDRRPGG